MLTASTVLAVCHDSSVLISGQIFPLSIFATLETLTLFCISDTVPFVVLNDLFVSPTLFHRHNVQGIFFLSFLLVFFR